MAIREMTDSMVKRSKKVVKRRKAKRRIGPDCRPISAKAVRLGTYFDTLNSVLRKGATFWFRGNADLSWRLTPSALRYRTPAKRNRALSLLSDFRRFGEMKLQKLPASDEQFKWIQLAQHYGLPTRLLDWTKNAAIALYFACCAEPEKDGAVFVLNPVDLNREAFPKEARILDPHQDAKLIKKYLTLDGNRNQTKGLKTIAINPTWNSERIMLQQGVFTLHGSRYFTLTDKQAPSLVYLKIAKEYKEVLQEELDRIGVSEMSIFPEAEHMCRYLKWREKLDLKG
jgi:hypothetical protein